MVRWGAIRRWLGGVLLGALFCLPAWGGSLRLEMQGLTALAIQANGVPQGNAGTINFASGLTATVVGNVATITAIGAVSSVTGGAGISVSPTVGAVVVTNTGVLSAASGPGIGVSGATGAVTFTNTGVLSVVPEGNFSYGPIAGTGNVTFDAIYGVDGNVMDLGITKSAGTGAFARVDHVHRGPQAEDFRTFTLFPWTFFNVQTGTPGIDIATMNDGGGVLTLNVTNTGVTQVNAGAGVSVTGATGSVTISATGAVSSVTAGTGISVSPTIGNVVVTNTFPSLPAQQDGVPKGSGTTINFTNGLKAAVVGATINVSPTYADIAPAAAVAGVGQAGSTDQASRFDHVHPGPNFYQDGVIGSGGGQTNFSAINFVGGLAVGPSGALSNNSSGSISVTPTYATPTTIGSANAQGSANSFARSDHVHAGVASIIAGAGISLVGGPTGNVTITNALASLAVQQDGVAKGSGTTLNFTNGLRTQVIGSTINVSPTYQSTVSALGTALNSGINDTVARSDHIHTGPAFYTDGSGGNFLTGINGVQGLQVGYGSAGIAGTVNITPTYSTGIVDTAATNSNGTANTFSRGDHQHRAVRTLSGGTGVTISGGTSGSGDITATWAGVPVQQTASAIGTALTLNIAGGTGISTAGSLVGTTVSVTVTNAGVTSAVAGTGITVSGATGAVTIATTALLNIPISQDSISKGNATAFNFTNGLRAQVIGGTVNVSPTYQSTVSSLGTALSPGINDTVARSDHIHTGPAFYTDGSGGSFLTGINGVQGLQVGYGSSGISGTVNITPTYATPVSIGSANAAGSANSFARSDHVHNGVATIAAGTGITLTGGPTGNVTVTNAFPNLAIQQDGSSKGTATTVNFNAGILAAVSGTTANVSPSYGTTIGQLGTSASAGVLDQPSRTDHIHRGPRFYNNYADNVVFFAGLNGVNGIQMGYGSGGGLAAGTVNITPTYATTTQPVGHGTGGATDAGTANTFSRGDHAHPGPSMRATGDSASPTDDLIINGGTGITTTSTLANGSRSVTLTATGLGTLPAQQDGVTKVASVLTLNFTSGLLVGPASGSSTTANVTPNYAATTSGLATAAAAGTALTISRGDHQHVAPTVNINGVTTSQPVTTLVLDATSTTTVTQSLSSGTLNVTFDALLPPQGTVTLNVSVTSNTAANFTADAIALWDGNTVVRAYNVSVTPDIATAGPAANGRDQSGAFTAGDGAGGGTTTWIYGYFIWGSSKGLAGYWSTTPPTTLTGPATLPTGYTHWCIATEIMVLNWIAGTTGIPPYIQDHTHLVTFDTSAERNGHFPAQLISSTGAGSASFSSTSIAHAGPPNVKQIYLDFIFLPGNSVNDTAEFSRNKLDQQIFIRGQVLNRYYDAYPYMTVDANRTLWYRYTNNADQLIVRGVGFRW